eukprot:c4829_g1_i1.p1 GENE.c4829_g1_i1~~c4829_g1_i1.p1  ORF type:complete len:168 (-),score=34.07 c4829_g1_i1:138-641(-)
MESIRAGATKVYSKATGQTEEPTLWDQMENNLCPSLSKTQRLYGFCICFVVGIVISVIGYITLLTGNLTSFAVLYTFGNLVAIASSSFIAGPCRQLKSMFSPTRRIATIVYLLAIILTLVVAFATGKPALCILMIIVQWLALIWYILTYIPYGRKMVTNCCKSTLGL